MTSDKTPDPKTSPTSDYQDADSFQHEAAEHVFTFYPRGSDRLEALVDHIEKAEKTLDVFYYMFQDDKSGSEVLTALVDAAKRGVEVSLIVDDFGSDASAEFFNPLIEAGGDFAIFSADWNVKYLVRNHQKFAIADNARVMTGGSNVSDHYYNPPQDNGWCDLGVAIEGEVVKKFTEWFGLMRGWTNSDGSQFRKVRKMIRSWDPGDGPIQLLMGGPLIRRDHWSYRFKRDLVRAKQIDLVTAYFGPPISIRRLIRKVAKRGRARLITAGKSDIDATIAVARLFYKRLLSGGARIAEFQPCKLHMKLLVVDDASYFGSANLDRRSVRINIELMVRVEDEGLAARLREFVGHLEKASVVVDEDWYAEQDGFFNRLRRRFYHMISIADYRIIRAFSD